MYEYIKGTVAEVAPAYAVIDVGGVGYYLHISLETYSAIEHETETRLYVHYVVREDAQLLYGFSTKAERELFRLLISVSGVGGNTARMILSTYSPRELQGIITAGNAVLLKNVKGLGLKTAQKIIVELSGDAAHDLVGPAPVAAAGALDAQFARREDGDRLVDTALEPGFEQDGAFEDHVATLLPRRPGIEITHNDRMHQCIEVSQRLRVGKDDAREVSPVELPVAESPLAEATGKLPPQRPILLHQPFGRSVRIVNRNALLCKKAADSALAAADAARNSYFHHSCPSGKSISGTASIEVILISLNFTEIAFCNDCGSMMIRPSCPSSRERLYLSAESGMRSVLFM